MTAEEKKMTHESAKEIVARVDNMEEAAGRFNNLADLGSRYWIAKGFLLGRESGIRESAEIAKEFTWGLPLFKTERENDISDDAACAVCEQIADALLKLLSDGREKDKP